MKNCFCTFKQQMIAELLKLPERHPEGRYAWVKPLFGNAPEREMKSSKINFAVL